MKITALLIIAVLTVFFTTSCNIMQTISMSDSTIHVFIPTTDTYFLQQVEEGLDSAATDSDININIYEYDITQSSTQVIKQIKKSIRLRPAAILMVPFEDDELVPVLGKAEKRNIPVVFMDKQSNSFRPNTFIYSNNEIAAQKAGEQLVSLMNGTGKVVIINTILDNEKAMQREAGFNKVLREHPELRFINTFYCEGDLRNIKLTITDILAVNPDVKGIFAACPNTAIGVARAIDDMGLGRDISIVGFDQTTEVVHLINQDMIDAVIIQNAYDIGVLAVETAMRIWNNETVEDSIDTGYIIIDKNT